jgi:hypothetical protein
MLRDAPAWTTGVFVPSTNPKSCIFKVSRGFENEPSNCIRAPSPRQTTRASAGRARDATRPGERRARGAGRDASGRTAGAGRSGGARDGAASPDPGDVPGSRRARDGATRRERGTGASPGRTAGEARAEHSRACPRFDLCRRGTSFEKSELLCGIMPHYAGEGPRPGPT